jgi:hypothetical protein
MAAERTVDAYVAALPDDEPDRDATIYAVPRC